MFINGQFIGDSGTYHYLDEDHGDVYFDWFYDDEMDHMEFLAITDNEDYDIELPSNIKSHVEERIRTNILGIV
jgi:hypothetical protein